jgi:hypothetical protein
MMPAPSGPRAKGQNVLKAKELLAMTALTIHTISFMNRMMADSCTSIAADDLDACQKRWMTIVQPEMLLTSRFSSIVVRVSNCLKSLRQIFCLRCCFINSLY